MLCIHLIWKKLLLVKKNLLCYYDNMIAKFFEDLVGDFLVQTSRMIKIRCLELFSDNDFEITPEQFVVLSMIQKESNLHQRKLCEILNKDKSNMTRILTILDKKGLIQKVVGIENKKQVNKIIITDKGRELSNKMTPVMSKFRKEYLNSINNDDLYTCIKVLSKIQENLKQKDSQNGEEEKEK